MNVVSISKSNGVREVVIGFEDLEPQPAAMGPLRPGYEGFTWSEGAWFVKKQLFTSIPIASQVGLLNAHGSDITIQSDRAFDFRGSYIASLWADAVPVVIEGWEKDKCLYSQTVTTSRACTWYAFEFEGIDRLVFRPSGAHIVIDNITLVLR